MGIGETKIANETVAFILSHITQENNNLGNAFRSAKNYTEHFNGEAAIQLEPRGPDEFHTTVIEVTNESTFMALERLHKESTHEPCVLNFGDAFREGGLFLGGAVADEEQLCRSSGLYYCLKGHEFYRKNATRGKSKPTNVLQDLLYSPQVPVIRDSSTNEFLSEDCVYNISVITSPTLKYYAARYHLEEEVLGEIFQEQVWRILTLISNKRKEIVVLGTTGKDPETVARTFSTALNTTFKNHFKRVVFAVYKRSDTKNLTIFQNVFTTFHES